jgi:hypothetical protein
VRLAPGFGPSVAMNATGDAVVGFVFASLTETMSRTHGTSGWSAPAKLTEGGSAPNVALDTAGDAFAVFTKGQWPSEHFQASYRAAATGAWQDAITVSPAAQTTGGEIAVNPRGDAVAAFTRWPGTGYVIQAAMRPAASGTWQQVVDLSDPNGNSPRGAGVAIDNAGNAVALWVRAGPVADNPVVVSAFRPAGGTWTAPVELGGPYRDVWDMHITFDAAGNAVAVWRASFGSGAVYAVFSSYRAFGGSWTGPTIVSPPNRLLIDDLSLSVDDAGNALALWTEITQRPAQVVVSAARPAVSGTWQPSVQLSPSAVYAFDAALTSDRAGNAVAVWGEAPGPTVHAALRPAASATWEPSVQIAIAVGTSGGIAAGIDEHGNALAVWQGQRNYVYDIESSDLKAGGPVLARLTVPGHGAAGVTTRFRVTPAPWGSPLVGEPAWDFGDGTTSAGKSVAHVYRRTGRYTVAVTQSDAAGGSSRSTAEIVVVRATLANRRRPTITGRPHVGSMLTCAPGSWSGSQPIRFRYAWLRGGRPIGAGPRYRARSHDAGALLSCRVTATNGPLTRAATSRPVRIRG